MHVDGFRFDLASALTRGGDGKAGVTVSARHPGHPGSEIRNGISDFSD